MCFWIKEWINKLRFESIYSESKTNEHILRNRKKTGGKQDFWNTSYVPGILHVLSYFLLQLSFEVENIMLILQSGDRRSYSF